MQRSINGTFHQQLSHPPPPAANPPQQLPQPTATTQLMQLSISSTFHQQLSRPPPPLTSPPQQLPQPTAVTELQQHVVAVASTQSDSPPQDTAVAQSNHHGSTDNLVNSVEAHLTRIARLAQQLPGGGPIRTLAASALTDLLLDSQTESQLLRDLEIEQPERELGEYTGDPPQQGAPAPEQPSKRARTNPETDPTAAALQRIISKAQARMASAGEHIYVSYYDIQHDVDVVLKWLNDYVFGLQNRGTSSSSSAAAPPGDTNTLQAVQEAMPALAAALYGVQRNSENEHWQNLAEIAMMLQAVLAGGIISHPADVIAENRGVLTSNLARARRSNRARGILLELRGLGGHLANWPLCEINPVHAALLAALEDVEQLMHIGGQGALPSMDRGSTTVAGGNTSETGGTRPAADWWLHERHHGLGNAPGTEQRSPTEAMDSGSEQSHRRRRLHAALDGQ